jgi:hypothetical protein
MEDSACGSTADGLAFAAWFDRLATDDVECAPHVANVPLSRIYGVIDEATRRSAVWASFADQLSARVEGTSRH